MKTAICYYSYHHGNTRKVVEAMVEGEPVDLIDISTHTDVDLNAYDTIGFASGIYAGSFHKSLIRFAQEHLPEGKDVFLVYTYAMHRPSYIKSISDAVYDKHANLLGVYCCRGFNTFGPFKLIGGTAKGHPNADDLTKAKAFYRSLR